MTISVTPGYFSSRDEAIAEIEAGGFHVAEAMLTEKELTGVPHVHPYRVDIYLLEGVLELREPAIDGSYVLRSGSKAVVPAGTLHAESCPGTFRAVFGVSRDLRSITDGWLGKLAQQG